MAQQYSHTAYAQLVRLAASAMVTLGTTTGMVSLGEGMATIPNPLFFSTAQAEATSIGERVFEKTSPAIVAIATQDSRGSGVFIRPDGLILTNAHVVGKDQTVTVVLKDGTSLKGDVVAVGEGYFSHPSTGNRKPQCPEDFHQRSPNP
jgi:S1-C subfamily serine protease